MARNLDPVGQPGGRATRALLIAAAVYSVALIVGGFLVPVYTSESVTSSGAIARESQTLVEVNGAWVLVVLTIPLLVTIGVAASLRRGPSGRLAAWLLVFALGVFTVLSLLSIGLFVLPVTLTLVIACALAPRDTGSAG